jgi:hypothetical protein
MYAKAPTAKTTPVTGLQLVNRENKGTFVLDQQNAVNTFKEMGFLRVDPSWYLNIARRVTNLDSATVVCNLHANDPIVCRQYLYTSWLWSEHGFRVVHVPPRKISINANPDDHTSESGQTEVQLKDKPYFFKDMTDIGVRTEIRFSSVNSAISRIIIGSHDIDYATDIRQATWGKSKKVTLLTVGDKYISSNLIDSADEAINVLIYSGTFSAQALNKRQWWKDSESLATRKQKIEKWFSGNGVYPKYMEYQFDDMQRLFSHLLYDLNLAPAGTPQDNRRLSFGRLKFAIHEFWRPEKIMAELPVSIEPAEDSLPFALENQELRMPTEQVRALDKCLTEMINLFIQNQILLFDHEGATATKLYYLNTEHPAVQAILETGFG